MRLLPLLIYILVLHFRDDVRVRGDHVNVNSGSGEVGGSEMFVEEMLCALRRVCGVICERMSWPSVPRKEEETATQKETAS